MNEPQTDAAEVHEVAPEDLADLFEMLASEGKSVVKVEILDDGALYRCTAGPWPRRGRFPEHPPKRRR
jgi:hypothetical protein